MLGNKKIEDESLELAFESKALRAICESVAQAERELGSKVAEVLIHRLADLRAATSPKDLLAGRPKVLNDLSYECMAVDLYDGFRLVFRANHHPRNPLAGPGQVDWLKVSRVKILLIERDHA